MDREDYSFFSAEPINVIDWKLNGALKQNNVCFSKNDDSSYMLECCCCDGPQYIMFEINAFKLNDKLLIEFRHLKGDRTTFHKIYNHIGQEICDDFIPTNIMAIAPPPIMTSSSVDEDEDDYDCDYDYDIVQNFMDVTSSRENLLNGFKIFYDVMNNHHKRSDKMFTQGSKWLKFAYDALEYIKDKDEEMSTIAVSMIAKVVSFPDTCDEFIKLTTSALESNLTRKNSESVHQMLNYSETSRVFNNISCIQ
jgi:hypothetical protein